MVRMIALSFEQVKVCGLKKFARECTIFLLQLFTFLNMVHKRCAFYEIT